MSKSKFLSINARDFIRGLWIAIGGAVSAAAIKIIESKGHLSKEDYATIGTVAICATLGYIKLNLFTNSSGNVGPEK